MHKVSVSAFDYPIEICDVVDRRNLVRYREKAERWFEWLDGDPEHSISLQLSEMLQHDAIYRCLNECRRPPKGVSSIVSSGAVRGFLDRGYVSEQVLAISRLVDRRSDVVSLRRLLDELTDARGILTREVFVSHDGLPYDYLSVMRSAPLPNGEFQWHDTSGPMATSISLLRHEEFDRLSGILASDRSRSDLLHVAVFEKLREQLDSGAIAHMVSLRHKRIAHAATLASRSSSATTLTMNLVADAHRALLQVAQVIQAVLLYGSWRGGAIPIPQYDLFEHFESPVAAPGMSIELHRFWDGLTEERDGWLSDALAIIR